MQASEGKAVRFPGIESDWHPHVISGKPPLWGNVIQGQLNLRDAIDRKIDFTSPEGKRYALRPDAELATIVVRPRGWHLPEKHILVDGVETSGAIVDFALYLPKMESHLEARLWNEVFIRAQEILGIPRGTIRATALIETYPAAFEMDEILYELREHSSGLNAGRWDYMFSIIKSFRTRGREFLLPDRNSVTMTAPFMRAYTELLVQTCHKRGAHAMVGCGSSIMAEAFASGRWMDARETFTQMVLSDDFHEFPTLPAYAKMP